MVLVFSKHDTWTQPQATMSQQSIFKTLPKETSLHNNILNLASEFVWKRQHSNNYIAVSHKNCSASPHQNPPVLYSDGLEEPMHQQSCTVTLQGFPPRWMTPSLPPQSVCQIPVRFHPCRHYISPFYLGVNQQSFPVIEPQWRQITEFIFIEQLCKGANNDSCPFSAAGK